MATKKTTLSAALLGASGKPVPEPEQKATEAGITSKASTVLPASRQGKKAITGHFDPAVSKQLKQLALEHDKTVQTAIAEALNDLFIKYGRNPIA